MPESGKKNNILKTLDMKTLNNFLARYTYTTNPYMNTFFVFVVSFLVVTFSLMLLHFYNIDKSTLTILGS